MLLNKYLWLYMCLVLVIRFGTYRSGYNTIKHSFSILVSCGLIFVFTAIFYISPMFGCFTTLGSVIFRSVLEMQPQADHRWLVKRPASIRYASATGRVE